MKHSVIFDNVDNHWDNALPFGNGTFGCMQFFERKKLYMPMNHYEVYYNISDPLLPEDKLKAMPECKTAGAEHERCRKQADSSQPGEDGLACLFRSSRETVLNNKTYGIFKFSETFPQTGELVFSFDGMDEAKHSLSLLLEDAKGILELECGEKRITVETIVSRRDCIINTIKQSESGILRDITVAFPDYRDGKPPVVSYRQTDGRTVMYTASYAVSENKNAVFSGALRFVGATVKLSGEYDNNAVISILDGAEDICLITGIFTDWKYIDTEEAAVCGMDTFEAELGELIDEHRKYYLEFFDRSAISLPDKFLEKIYYINQYALDCCSGKDGIMKHQACGLNGLWAIRHPNLWGSKWYWDVNIQAAFAGVFSSNRLDLAKVFSDGLMTYKESAERHARDVHGMTGMSIDYPYDFYYSCFVWCSQYMWFLYEYSLDKDYLKNEAYPVFLKLCEFCLQLFEYDSSRDKYCVYPDISPEQGPLAHNTVITVACVKYLFKYTLRSAQILGDSSEILDKVSEMLKKLPEYPLSKNGDYGVHFRDSEDAADNMWIRHPSMLMPVFPIGEIDEDSDSTVKEHILNTLAFLEDNCEIGIFGCSWIAAAAARMGKGQMALRILYERGIDHMLRSNGLTAEETDRFINYCLITRQPLYYPCMMEFSGEMLAAVNEMLIASHNGVVKVFPALPDGDPEYERYQRRGSYLGEYLGIRHEYEKWENVSFSRLLAKGAFEVSAKLEKGVASWVSVLSKMGGRLKLSCKYFPDNTQPICDGRSVPFTKEGDVFVLDTEAGKTYIFGCENKEDTKDYDNSIDTHVTYTKRLISVGENSETVYRKKLDSAMRDWYYGNSRMANHTVYKFDFTKLSEKNYAAEIPMQRVISEGIVMGGMDFVRLGGEVFTHERGYGFDRQVNVVDRAAPDLLRRDFAEGVEDTEFIIEMPRGQYELLVVSGDENQESLTIISGENSRRAGGKKVPAGCFQCELIPIIQEYDEPLVLKLSTVQGFKWKLNAIIVNVIKGY